MKKKIGPTVDTQTFRASIQIVPVAWRVTGRVHCWLWRHAAEPVTRHSILYRSAVVAANGTWQCRTRSERRLNCKSAFTYWNSVIRGNSSKAYIALLLSMASKVNANIDCICLSHLCNRCLLTVGRKNYETGFCLFKGLNNQGQAETARIKWLVHGHIDMSECDDCDARRRSTG